MSPTLNEGQVEQFIEDGFVRVNEAFPRSVADAGRALLWRMSGMSADDPSTWTSPMVRLGGSAEEPFRLAANTPRLLSAFDQLVGPGRWLARSSLGTFPIRFPHPDDPGDTGWHMDGSFTSEGKEGSWLNLRSRGRALLMLFLFSEVSPDEAPTRIKVGSHLDVPAFLAPAGDEGMNFFDLCRAMDEAGRLDAPDRPLALATGSAGDVYLCHPFLIHAAQPHGGSMPRFIAQPPLYPVGLLDLDRHDGAYSPAEVAVRRGLQPLSDGGPSPRKPTART